MMVMVMMIVMMIWTLGFKGFRSFYVTSLVLRYPLGVLLDLWAGETLASAHSPTTSNAHCGMWNPHRYKVPFPDLHDWISQGSLYVSTSQNVKLDGPKSKPKTLPFEGPKNCSGFKTPPGPGFTGEPGKRLDRSLHHQCSGTFDLGRYGTFNGWWRLPYVFDGAASGHKKIILLFPGFE